MNCESVNGQGAVLSGIILFLRPAQAVIVPQAGNKFFPGREQLLLLMLAIATINTRKKRLLKPQKRCFMPQKRCLSHEKRCLFRQKRCLRTAQNRPQNLQNNLQTRKNETKSRKVPTPQPNPCPYPRYQRELFSRPSKRNIVPLDQYSRHHFIRYGMLNIALNKKIFTK